MKFVIGVYAAPYHTQGTVSAWHFVTAARQQGHEIQQIFFSQGGVLNASRFIEVGQDEVHWPTRWQTFQQETQTPLFVCHSSALKYGITDAQLMPGFQWGGLTQFAQALLETDRHLIFGD